ncbi:MAG: CDP-alcohol phosphatidyltransferase family protein, partial [Candidatus Binatia bacterium]
MPERPLLAASARVLTVFRVVTLPAFLWMLFAVAGGDGEAWRAPLATLYVAVALSDFVDGRLARAAAAATPRWAVLDVAADVTFNLASLVSAAWLGRIGLWVPAGVAVLAGRFVLRNLRHEVASGDRLSEDRAGKLAGVAYYALVGLI